MEQGKGESIAPGVTRQRLVNADARWGDSGAAENLSQGQQRPSSLRGPGPKTPRAPRPAGMHACRLCTTHKPSHAQSITAVFPFPCLC